MRRGLSGERDSAGARDVADLIEAAGVMLQSLDTAKAATQRMVGH